MVGTYFFHGFPNLGWFLGCAWVCLIVGGVLVLIWEKIGFFNKTQETSEAAMQDHAKMLAGCDAFVKGEAYYLEKQNQKALACFDEAIECGFNDEAYGLRAQCLQGLDFDIEAIEDFTRAISLKPEDCNLYFLRSNSRDATGDNDGAVQDLQKAIQLSEVDNKLNRAYSIAAKSIGYRNGHTSMYLMSLDMVQLTPQVLQDRRKKNLKRRNGKVD